jgi:hypothetical protein
VLAHLLLQQGQNLASFIGLINDKLPPSSKLQPTNLSEAQVYVEFTFLRDYWDTFKGNNEVRRKTIFDLLARVDSLSHYRPESFPTSPAEFNEVFMGPRGLRIVRDIVYPGQWSVAVLAERFRHHPAEFRDFCRFKWSFNIKPDVVVLLPGTKPLCIEAKLESPEGWYPASSAECELFDNVFGLEQGRVGQVELQEFMFDRLLGTPCQLVTVGLVSGRDDSVPVRWNEVFQALDLGQSLPHVRRLIEENVHLRRAH